MLTKNNILKYFGIVLLATFLSFLFHEIAHWVSYELLGFDASFTLNTANVKDKNVELTKMQNIISDASGPIFTIFQAIFFYFLLLKKNNIFLYPFLFIAFVQRLMAGIFNTFQPNDEGRISLNLDLNLYTISIIVSLFLFWLVYRISKKNKYAFKTNSITFIFCAISILIIVLLDNKFHIQFV